MDVVSVCQRYIDFARAAVDEWDGVSTAELFLLILARTGEGVEVLQDAKHKLERGLAPVGGYPRTPAEEVIDDTA